MTSALKNFAVTFLIALVIFGIIAYFATSVVTGTVQSILKSEKENLSSIIGEADDPSDQPGNEPLLPDSAQGEINGESFTFLLAVTDYRPDEYDDYILSASSTNKYIDAHPASTVGLLGGNYREAHVSSLVLVRVDKETGTMVYLYVSPFMRVSTPDGERSLSEIYYRFGMDRLEEHLGALTGLSVDYTFLISGYNLDDFTGVAGTVLVNNPRDVYNDGKYNTYSTHTVKNVYDEDGERRTVSVPNEYVLYTGDLEMTAERLFEALSVIEHSKSDVGTKQVVATSVSEEYIENLSSLSQSALRDFLTNVITTKGIVVTDFDVNELNEIYELFSHAGEFESQKIMYPCSYIAATDGTPDGFRPNIDEALKTLERYRKSAE